MGARGTGRGARSAFLIELSERDPELAAELEALRRYDPPAYRRRVRRIAAKQGLTVPGGSSRTGAPTPGRASDPALRVGPGGDTTAEDLRDVATIRAIEAERAAPEAREVEAPAEPPAEAPAEAPKKKARKKG